LTVIEGPCHGGRRRRKYIEEYGIGPWKVYEFNPGNAGSLREYGRPVKRSWRLAVAMVGELQWELIEPLDDEGIYARFLAEIGGVVHHIAVAARHFDEMLAAEAKRGIWNRRWTRLRSLPAR